MSDTTETTAETTALCCTSVITEEMAHGIYLDAIEELQNEGQKILKQEVMKKINHVRKLERLLEIAKHDLQDFIANMEAHKEKLLFGDR